MIKDLSAKLIAAAAEINKKSYESYHAEQRALQEKLAAKQIKMPNQPAPKADAPAHSGAADMAKKNIKAVKEAAEGSHPRTEKEKQLAKLHGDPNKITHGDVLKGRGVRKEAFADMMRDVKKGTGKFDKKITSTGTVYTRKSSTFDDGDDGGKDTDFDDGGKDTDMKKAEKKMKSEADEQMSHQAKTTMKHIPDASPDLKKAAKDIKPGVAGYRDRIAMLKAGGVKEEAEQVELTQEGWDDMMKASQAKAGEEKAAKGTGKFNKKVVSTGTVYTRKASTFDDGTGKDSDERRQDRERRKAMKEGLMATMRRISKKVIDTVGHKDDTDLIKGMQKQAGVPQTGKKPVAENMDTPGNSTHQCAIHVKSEQFGEGRCLTTQHAEPVDGFVEWYDVMFAEGIKRVNVADVEVLEAMSHGNHTKKKAK